MVRYMANNVTFAYSIAFVYTGTKNTRGIRKPVNCKSTLP